MQTLLHAIKSNLSDFSTPCYVYSESAVRESYAALSEALGTALIYSVKSNANPDLMQRVASSLRDGIEVASIHELERIKPYATRIYLNNPSADKAFLQAGIDAGATLIIDNLPQLELIADLHKQTAVSSVLLRLNSVVLSTFNAVHPKVRADQFGMDWATAQDAIRLCRQFALPLQGFHVFKGSYSFERTAFATVDAAKDIIDAMEAEYGQPLSFANLGGGFGEHWQQSAFDFAAYREKLATLPKHIQIAHESGRGLMANIGCFLTTVRYLKTIEASHFAICDGGIAQSFLLAQTENTFRKLKAPLLLSAASNVSTAQPNTQSAQEQGACVYVGSSCSKDDVIGKQGDDAQLPIPGDVCVFTGCGAYYASYTVSPFLLLPQPRTYIIQ